MSRFCKFGKLHVTKGNVDKLLGIPIPICGNPLNNVWHCSGRFRQKWHASWITSIHYMMKKSVIM